MKILVSIVLPTYNGERYIRQSIQSIIDQTYKNWELIIVDDASTDSTPEIIEKFVSADPRIRLVRHDTNRRLPAALNTGFADTKGDFLTWTSDDNYYHSNALETLAEYLIQHTEVGLIYTDWDLIDQNGNQTETHYVKPPEKLAFGNVVGPSFLYRREVYEKVGDYEEDFLYVEDYDYWLRASSICRLSCLHQSLYSYRTHENRLTDKRTIDATHRFLMVQYRNFPKIGWLDNKQRAEAYKMLARHALLNKHYFLFTKCVVISIFHEPRNIFHWPNFLIYFSNFKKRG